MVQARGRERGGILSLCDLIEEHGEAIEYDLLALGLRLRWLGSDLLTWRDLKSLISQSPRTSALARSINPDVIWGLTEHVLAKMSDDIAWLKWSKTRDGAKNRNHPEPIPRPGVTTKDEAIGSDPLPVPEMLDWLGWT